MSSHTYLHPIVVYCLWCGSQVVACLQGALDELRATAAKDECFTIPGLRCKKCVGDVECGLWDLSFRWDRPAILM